MKNNYKHSNQELLNGKKKLPGFNSKWKEYQLDELCDFKKGSGLSKEKTDESGKNQCILYGEIYTTYKEYIDEVKTRTNLEEGVTSRRGDILIPASTTTSHLDLATATTVFQDGILLGGDINILRSKKDNLYNNVFLSFYLTHVKKNELARFAQGVTIVHLYGAHFKKLKVKIPNIEEQNRIVRVLEKWDKGINTLKEKIEIKKQIKKGLMQELLTGRKRLPRFNKVWKETMLADVSDFQNGYAFKSSTYVENTKYKIITIANVQKGRMDLKKVNTIDLLPTDLQDGQKLDIGDILISMTGNIGRVCLVSTYDCLLNQRVGKIEPRNIDKDFLYFVLSQNHFLEKMIDAAQGGAQDNISVKDIREYTFFLPEDREQKAIAQVLTTADNGIATLEKKLELWQEQKKYLLNNLVMGHIRTPEDILINSNII